VSFRTLMPTIIRAPSYPVATSDSMHFLFDTTIEGGTSASQGAVSTAALAGFSASQWITVKADAILQYERAIIELRRELLHYKEMVTALLGSSGDYSEYQGSSVVVPLDKESITLVNSVVRANIPPSATFKDFEEGEL
jgi:hypothetical protein